MRLRRHISNEALCPFYRSEDDFRVLCEGVVDASSIHVVFQSSKKKHEYSKRYCCGNYKSCKVSHMLYAKYGGEEK